MTSTPAHPRIDLPGISSRAWEHPADRSALVTLRSLSGFDTILKTLSGLLRERQHRLLYLASAVRVDERQFASIDRLFGEALQVLDSPTRPELYVIQNPVPNAVTIGMDVPFIVLNTGLVDLLDEDELRFVLGHEIGHAMSGHAVYQTMLQHLLRLAGNFGWLPVGGWALRALVAALMEWSRKAELSGDRAGLLATQDPEVALRVMMKLAGGSRLGEMSTGAFLEQADEYESTGDLRDGVLKLLNLELKTHPFSVVRAAQMRDWVVNGEYRSYLDGNYPRRADDPTVSVGEEIRSAARSYKSGFDTSTDPLITTVRGLGRDVGGVAQTVGSNISDAVSDIWGRFDGWRRSREDAPG
ncbi:M48 family peptidase, partial [Nakamurella silvestris]